MHMIMSAAGRNRLRAQNGCLVLTCALLNSVHSPGIGQFEMANYVPLRLYGSPSCLFTLDSTNLIAMLSRDFDSFFVLEASGKCIIGTLTLF